MPFIPESSFEKQTSWVFWNIVWKNFKRLVDSLKQMETLTEHISLLLKHFQVLIIKYKKL